MRRRVQAWCMGVLLAATAGWAGAQHDPARIAEAYQRVASANADLVQRATRAIDRGERDAFQATLALQPALSVLHDPQVQAKGGDAAWSRVQDVRQSLPGLRLVPRRVIAGRHFAAVVADVGALQTGGAPGGEPRMQSGHALVLGFMRNGEIRNLLVYLGDDDLGGPAPAASASPMPQVVTAPPPPLKSSVLQGLHAVSLQLVQARLAELSGDARVAGRLRSPLGVSDLRHLEPAMAATRRAIPKLRLKLDDYLSAGEHIVLLVSVQGQLEEPLGRFRRIGSDVEARAAVVVHAVDGRPGEVEVFLDRRSLERLR